MCLYRRAKLLHTQGKYQVRVCSLLSPFPFLFPSPHTHTVDACMNMPLTEILWDFDMMAALLDFDIGSDSTHNNNNKPRLLNGHIDAKWRIRTHRLFSCCTATLCDMMWVTL